MSAFGPDFNNASDKRILDFCGLSSSDAMNG